MPVEIRELIIRTEVETPYQQNQEDHQNEDDNSCQSAQVLNEEIINQIMENIKRQKER